MLIAPVLLASLLALPPATQKVMNQPARDPWVIRSVLDNRARIVSLELAPDLWIAYDATNCGLYRFWKGGIKFDGSVYTTVHGPQPTTVSKEFTEGVLDQPVWSASAQQIAVPVKAIFRGYKYPNPADRATVSLQYDLKFGGKTIRVTETPRLVWNGDSVTGIQRAFKIDPSTPMLRGTDLVVIPRKGARPLTFSGSVQITEAFGPFKVDRPKPAPKIAPKAKVQAEPRSPGLAYRAYQVAIPLNQIPKLVPNQTPNVSKVIPVINLTGEDFGLVDRFYAEITGWIKIEEPGLYQFRISSDDGSIFSIKGETIINNDGLHSSEPTTGSTDLEDGSHPIKVAYFQNDVDKSLRLEWMKPGDTEWSIIPNSAFETIANDVKVTSPGNKLVLNALWPRRAGDGRPLEGVHPSFTLSPARPDGFQPKVGGIDFLPDGRLVMCAWEPDGGVYIVSGVQTGDPAKIKVKRIASGLAEPLGLKVVGKTIYVLQKQELTKLVDTNGDEIIDEYYALANGWGVTTNFHEFAFGLVYKDGFFHATLATAIDPGGKSSKGQSKDRGKTIKIDAKTGEFTLDGQGLRTPNGIGMNVRGEIFMTDNQGDWLPSSKVLPYVPGGFYGNRSVDPVAVKDLPETPPVVWLPQGEIGNSPSQITYLNVGPYKDQLIHGDVTHGGIKRVSYEKVNGVYQGTVFRMTQGLEGGINRICWGPDKALYVGGIGSTGNWGQEGKEKFGLQRLAFNGKSTFEMLSARPMKNGFEIDFTEPVSKEFEETALTEIEVVRWRYEPTGEYGGPKVDEASIPVKSASLSPDRKRLFLELEGIQAGTVLYVHLPDDTMSASGKRIWSTEAWSTINVVPSRMGTVKPIALRADSNALSEAERAAGFVSLFDGKSLDAWKGYRSDKRPGGWMVLDASMTFIPNSGGGDLQSVLSYGDFDLRFDWRVSSGGNSGVMYRVRDTRGAPWETGPEYQILDNANHGDGKSPLTSAASLYGLYGLSPMVVPPANEWNHSRIVAKGGVVEHWLNGVKVVTYDLDSADFRERLAKSKFNGMPEFAKFRSGHLVLQDHGDVVAYRRIRIKTLP